MPRARIYPPPPPQATPHPQKRKIGVFGVGEVWFCVAPSPSRRTGLSELEAFRPCNSLNSQSRHHTVYQLPEQQLFCTGNDGAWQACATADTKEDWVEVTHSPSPNAIVKACSQTKTSACQPLSLRSASAETGQTRKEKEVRETRRKDSVQSLERCQRKRKKEKEEGDRGKRASAILAPLISIAIGPAEPSVLRHGRLATPAALLRLVCAAAAHSARLGRSCPIRKVPKLQRLREPGPYTA